MVLKGKSVVTASVSISTGPTFAPECSSDHVGVLLIPASTRRRDLTVFG